MPHQREPRAYRASDAGPPDPIITDLRIRLTEDPHSGLVAWVSCTLNSCLVLNNLALRRGSDGGLYVTYPAREVGSGRRYSYYHPVDEPARQAIQGAILSAVEGVLRTDRADD